MQNSTNQLLIDFTELKYCRVEGCGRTHHARGLCSYHYWHFKTKKTCLYPGCKNESRKAGLCQGHYYRNPLEREYIKKGEEPTVEDRDRWGREKLMNLRTFQQAPTVDRFESLWETLMNERAEYVGLIRLEA